MDAEARRIWEEFWGPQRARAKARAARLERQHQAALRWSVNALVPDRLPAGSPPPRRRVGQEVATVIRQLLELPGVRDAVLSVLAEDLGHIMGDVLQDRGV